MSMSAPGTRPPAPVHGGDGGGGGGGRPDASMSLLTDLFEHTVEDGYADAHRSRSAPHATPPRRRTVVTLRVAFFALLVVCAVSATAAVRQVLATEPGSSADHQALVREARERAASVTDLERQLVETRKEYTRAQGNTLASDAQGKQQVHQLERLRDTTGFDAVSGPGLVVTVDDAPENVTDSDAWRIVDRDLQLLVNGLWAAGAKAVSVNGQRLTALTAIREAGDAVLVDYRPLARPYVVSALGDRHTLEAAFADSVAGRYFSTLQANFDIEYTLEDRDELTLPAASTVTLQYAHGRNLP